MSIGYGGYIRFFFCSRTPLHIDHPAARRLPSTSTAPLPPVSFIRVSASAVAKSGDLHYPILQDERQM
ncbi:hypothetical protein GUJ93_ZPchr0008g12227 [Zizania palustris]|uniref:Uncharacterized protein n=1 Tax=Zizania palustris TaxID=103762 RepID=A0A8J5UWH9_ZIZPA|nr:hypothetical protein GUJ93_ZPchr0008g12227 [Zizania palustris]